MSEVLFVDYDLRQWLLILGPLFIVCVLLHGYWRMRRSQGELKMSLDRSYLSKTGQGDDVDDLSLLKAELPNGGARVIRKPEQTALELAEDVPVLMEPVGVAMNPEADSIPEPESAKPEESGDLLTSTESDDGVGSVGPEDSPMVADTSIPDTGDLAIAATADDRLVAGNERSARDDAEPVEKAPPARRQAQASPDVAPPEKFVIINVLANDEPFDGQRLLEVLLENDMTFGEMKIFHRLDHSGFSEFSLANAVEPGTLDPAAIEEMTTPGVTMFMRVHELADPLRAFNAMVDVAASIADQLGGSLHDETRSVMTEQTIEHSRQGIRDFLYRHSA